MNHTSAPVATVSSSARAAFIRKTYLHVFLAVLLFTGIETFFFKSGLAEVIFNALTSVSWLFVLGGFVLLSWIASRFAQSSSSKPVQYLGFTGFILLEAIIFLPMLVIAEVKTGGGAIESAATATLLGFGGLTAIAFGTRADFSWLGKILALVGVGALVAIVCGALFGFSLGTWFSVGMVIFAGAAILYDTSNIIHHYDESQYVAAALQLFASIALMFWYLLRFFTSRD